MAAIFKGKLWQSALKISADPERSRHLIDSLVAADAKSQLEKLPAESVQAFAALSGGSQFLGELLLTHPDWVSLLDPELLKFPRRAQGYQQEIGKLLGTNLKAQDFTAALAELRRFKQREQFRIAVRDLGRLSNVVEITRELSDVADVCLEAVFQIVRLQLIGRFGLPFHQDPDGNWQPTAFAVLGLGKLGGQELNYSSDVDLMFVYDDEGEIFREPPPSYNNREGRHPAGISQSGNRRSMSSHQFFGKLAETFNTEVSRTTEDGFLYRVDLRLRPEGDAGPLVRSLQSYENYYAQWGQTWERMMLIKARHVAGDKVLAAEFIEMVQPFRYPHFISERVLHEVTAVKDRIEREVVGEDELSRNVKLGHGGIREIEFVVQSLQVLHAGRLPFLQVSQTLPCLEKLVQYHLLTADEAQQLGVAYRFLRDVEHRLQMENNLQTHSIPKEPQARLRLARLMDFKSWEKFESALQSHTNNVRRIYERLLKSESGKAEAGLPREFDGAEAEWTALLAAHSFREPEKAVGIFKEFTEGPGDVHVSPRTADLARELIPKFLALCPKSGSKVQSSTFKVSEQANVGNAESKVLSDPDRVLTRLASFVSAYAARVPLLELWTGNPALFELMLMLFDRSEFLAEAAIHTPDLIDDVVAGERLRQRKTAGQILEELRYGRDDADQFLWLRRYHETELMRLGLRDILGLVDFEQNLVELSALADACLEYALEVVMRAHKIKKPPFLIVGLGKLGGQEIDYGSDLDLLFVTDARAKDLHRLQRLAAEVMELVSRRTEQGIVFHTDARLRPDGEKGLLVNTLDAYEDYYRHRAQLWEIQALSRIRPIAGNLVLGGKFQKVAAMLADFSKPNRSLAAFTPSWKKQIHDMRMRIERERTPRGQDDLAIKTGKGGLMDAEFIAQVLSLENGWHEANTLRALDRARQAGMLPEADKLLDAYRRLRHVEGILRRWSYEGEIVLPDDPAPYYRVSVRCGFATPDDFRQALAKWRKTIREVFGKVFNAGTQRRRGQ